MSENIFEEEFEQEAIDRIKRFGLLCESMGYTPVLGFSGGKDSQVCYDLCKRSGIEFKAKFNHCFESTTTMQFIREHYPEVEWRRVVKQGFFRNIAVNHAGLLPTVEMAYCCADYKHNRAYVDAATIIGVRRAESAARAKSNVLQTHTHTQLRKQHDTLTKYFAEHCMASGSLSEIQLMPIVDWSDEQVWDYIKRHNLPVNPEYNLRKRVGCIICPKADMNRNWQALAEHPKLIDCAIKAHSSRPENDWVITGDGNADYTDNKVEYICRWLNHSFRPFSKSQREKFEIVRQKYEEMKQDKGLY